MMYFSPNVLIWKDLEKLKSYFKSLYFVLIWKLMKIQARIEIFWTLNLALHKRFRASNYWTILFRCIFLSPCTFLFSISSFFFSRVDCTTIITGFNETIPHSTLLTLVIKLRQKKQKIIIAGKKNICKRNYQPDSDQIIHSALTVSCKGFGNAVLYSKDHDQNARRA